MKTTPLVILFTSILSGSMMSASAQEQDMSFQERIPKAFFENDDKFITITSENDFYGSGTDENYTNGIRISYLDVGSTPPKVAHFFDSYVPFFRINETTSVSYSIGQNLYTPEVITTPIPDPEDRPYAAFLYGSMGLTTIEKNHIDELEVTLGIIGPWALGEEVQDNYHALINADDPRGWDEQLDNELGVILSWQRSWPDAYATDFSDFHMQIKPHTSLSIGNVYTYAAAGATLQFTPKKYRWQTQPLRVRPAIPGNGYYNVPEGKFAWSLFSGIESRAIARNIFLDGNSFEDSPSVDKKPVVVDINAGVSLTYGRTQISYTLNWRSNEFDGDRSDEAVFGAVSVGYRF